jgi:enoyl-CoA hydratase/carnithine racemase
MDEQTAMTGPEDTVTIDVREGVAVLTLNRPERANAWTADMERRYFDLIDQADADPEIRVVVCTGSGRSFCPGMDMSVLDSMSRETSNGMEWRTRAITHALTLRKPLIGAINGATSGHGLVQALCCDVRFVAAEANIATGFARLGLPAESSVSWLLPRLVGTSRAADLLLSGRKITGEEAGRIGLADFVLPRERLLDAALAYARDIAVSCSPVAISTMKRQLAADWDRSQKQSLEEALLLMRDPMRRADFREGVAAYAQRRKPRFRGLPPAGVYW